MKIIKHIILFHNKHFDVFQESMKAFIGNT